MSIKKYRFQRLYWLIAGIVLILSNLFPLFARAGGAGGSYSDGGGDYGGGDGGGDGLVMLIYLIIQLIPFPFNILVIAALVVGFIITAKKKGTASPLNKIPLNYPLPDIAPVSLHSKKTVVPPDFNEAEFVLKVKTAFFAIQSAWSDKNLSNVRKYITDGIYQRFKTQFLMMDILKQKNLISEVEIFSVKIVNSESDGPYDSVTVLISAKANDRFISEIIPNGNGLGGVEYFSEYWSFIRKKGAQGKDLYNSSQCPGCGAEIPLVEGGVSKCPYCRKLLNTGEFDWVLAEITQADDYTNSRQPARKQQKLDALIEKIQEENPDFSVQVIEDRASNMFLHLLTADAKGSIVHARRFVSDQFYQKAESQGYFIENNMVFNRLYLNSVSLIAIGKHDGKNLLAVSIKQSSQRVIRKNSTFSLFDQSPLVWNWVVFLERNELSSQPPGAVTAFSCPHCGGELQDTTDIHCQYCGELVNSTRFDWVLTDCMTPDAFSAFQQNNPGIFEVSLEPDPTVLLYKVRDYTLNNVMVLLAADGVFTDSEKEFAEKLSKKWGYDIRQLEGFFQLAMSGRLVIRMPEDKKMRENIYRLMVKAAEADNEITPAEQNLLDSIKRTYLTSNV